MDAKQLLARTEEILLAQSHATLAEADAPQLHNALSAAAMEAVAPVWVAKEKERESGRQACYFSAEYLVGRLIYNNLLCMGVLEETRALLAERTCVLVTHRPEEAEALGAEIVSL